MVMKNPKWKLTFAHDKRDELFLRIALFVLILLFTLFFFFLGLSLFRIHPEKEAEKLDFATPSDLSGAKNVPKEESGIRILSAYTEEALDDYENLGIVQCDSFINLRSKPDQNDIGTIIGRLDNGAAVDILEMNPSGHEGWAHVKSGGMEGYVSASSLVSGEAAAALVSGLLAERVTVLADKLRIRTSPEIESGNTIGSAAKGEKYLVISKPNDDWVEIRTDNIDGVDTAYMSSKPENAEISVCLDEARSMDLRRKALNSYDKLGVSKASDYVNIRKTPEDKGISNIVGKFPSYAGANIVGEEGDWYQIKSGSVTGYVKKDYVATGREAEDLAVSHAVIVAVVNTDKLNVRSEPNTDSKVWTQITKNQRYDVLNQLDGWVQIDLDADDESGEENNAYISTRDNNVSVTYALDEAIEYYPAVEAANAAAERRNKVVNFACRYVGRPYVWGGTSLTHGADCSGFVLSVMKNYGVSLPRTSREQARCGTKVTQSSMKPGDLVFYANSRGRINHVAIYIGNGQVISASSKKTGIRISRWNYRTPVAIRNVLGS